MALSQLKHQCGPLGLTAAERLPATRGMLFSWGECANLLLGYPSHVQAVPKKVEFHCSPFYKQEYFLPRDVSKVQASQYHTLALTRQGQVWAFGVGRKGILGNGSEDHAVFPYLIDVPVRVADVAVGINHSLCVGST